MLPAREIGSVPRVRSSPKRQPGALHLTDDDARVRRPVLTNARIDEGDPIPQTSRVTAFVNTDEGLKVECWEIGGLTSQNQATRARGSKGIVGQTMLGNVEINLFRFEPSFTLFSFGANEVQSTAVDFRAQPK